MIEITNYVQSKKNYEHWKYFLTPEQRFQMYEAVNEYAFFNVIPDFNGDKQLEILFADQKKWIDNGKEIQGRKAEAARENGKKGGRPKKTKTPKQTVAPSTPNPILEPVEQPQTIQPQPMEQPEEESDDKVEIRRLRDIDGEIDLTEREEYLFNQFDIAGYYFNPKWTKERFIEKNFYRPEYLSRYEESELMNWTAKAYNFLKVA